MRPCRSLLPSWACRQCCWVCDRAVGERCTTESIASIHKLHHWCGDVHTVHKIHRYAINRTKNPIFSTLPPFQNSQCLTPALSPAQYLNPSCNIQVYWNCMEEKQCYLPHAHSRAHTNTNTATIKQCHSHCSIQYQHTVTTSAFHVPFKITRSSSPLLIEGEWLFLPLKRHMLYREEMCEGRKKGG